MGTVERLIHDTTLVELANFYIELKKQFLLVEKHNRIGVYFPNKAPEIDLYTFWTTIPTLCFIRSLMIKKLTNELQEEYLEIYGKEANNYYTSALDYTTYDEYALLKKRATELDLEDFFLIHSYIHHSKLTLPEEIEADMLETTERDKYIDEIHYLSMMELLKANKPTVKKRKNG